MHFFYRYIDIESKLKLQKFGVNNLSMLLPNNNFSNLRWFSIDDIYIYLQFESYLLDHTKQMKYIK